MLNDIWILISLATYNVSTEGTWTDLEANWHSFFVGLTLPIADDAMKTDKIVTANIASFFTEISKSDEDRHVLNYLDIPMGDKTKIRLPTQ